MKNGPAGNDKGLYNVMLSVPAEERSQPGKCKDFNLENVYISAGKI